MSLTKVSYSMIQGSPINVLDFGADPTGAEDSTAAFTAAQLVGKNIYAPQGTYLLDGLRIQNGVQIVGAGYENTIFQQASVDTPAINCLSDATTGQLSSVTLAKFKVIGAVGATAPAVLVAAYGIYAIWKSTFDYVASLTYRALEVQGLDANNVFRCLFIVSSEGTYDTSVVINGGTYNTFSLFLSNVYSGKALNFIGAACEFLECISDGQQYYAGNRTIINNAVVENWPGTSVTGDTFPAAIVTNGFSETFVNPIVIFDNATAAAKVTYAYRSFENTLYINPSILIVGSASLNNPFQADNQYKFAIIGPGTNGCVNKMDTIFTDTSDPVLSLRRVSFVGDCSAWTVTSIPAGGKAIQYEAPTTTFNFTVKNNTDAVIWEPTGTIAACNLNLPQVPVDNQVLSFSSTQTITTLNISSALPSGVNVSLVPTTIAANTQFSIIYSADKNKWYRI